MFAQLFVVVDVVVASQRMPRRERTPAAPRASARARLPTLIVTVSMTLSDRMEPVEDSFCTFLGAQVHKRAGVQASRHTRRMH